jgi:predicted Zn-dependent peptidase
LEIALGTLDTLKRDGAAADAVASARNYILGQYPLGFETAADWAAVLADLDLYGLPESYVEEFVPALQQVSPADIAEVVATAFPASADVDIALIADAARVRGEVAQLGQLIETELSAPQFTA